MCMCVASAGVIVLRAFTNGFHGPAVFLLMHARLTLLGDLYA